MVRTMDNLRLYDQLMPAIKACALAHGGAEQILKKSETIAALTLAEAMNSEKDDVKLKAAIEILNRTGGKPVERSVSIFADANRLADKDLDGQILQLMSRSGASALVNEALIVKAVAVKKARKPRKSKLFDEVIDVKPDRPE